MSILKWSMGLLSVLFTIICLSHQALASKKGLADQFDWRDSWGDVYPDTLIPAHQFNIKNDIYRAVQLCGVSSDHGAIHAYRADLNGDGLPDYIDSAAPYFTYGIKDTCPLSLCSDSEGCNISIYFHESQTQTLADPLKDKDGKTVLCPATPEENTSCRSDCPATSKLCPTLFTYNAPLGWDSLVKDWSVMKISEYNSMRNSNLSAENKIKYRLIFNNNNILKTIRGSKHCTFEEMDKNNDGNISVSEPCTKYYQYAYSRFIDMYSPSASELPATQEDDDRFTLVAYSRDVAMIDAEQQHNWRDEQADQSALNDLKISSKDGFLALQLHNYSGKKDYATEFGGKKEETESLLCTELSNTSANSYFVPTRTHFELESFFKAVEAGNLKGVTVKECSKKFTQWVGQTTCPSLSCGETVTIAAERRCQRSTSAYAACSECDNVADTAPIYNSADNKCFFSQTCSGGICAGGGNDCLPADAKVLMKDGSTKFIKDVKLGDSISAFRLHAPLSSPETAKVVQIHVTDRARVVEINNFRVSKNHILLKANGVYVQAKDIRINDELAGVSGQAVLVTNLNEVDDEEPVYNLTLEGADGYIVDGIRVLGIKP